MTSQRLLQPPDEDAPNTATEAGFDRKVFSSAEWLAYFESNKKNKQPIVWPQYLDIPFSVRVPIIKSLQRFQVGETGDGTHLRQYAKTLNDPLYEQCIDLFIKEENGHAQILARVIELMDGYLITWHWSDYAFVTMRHLLGLKTEIFIILTAEIVGKSFYRACADRLPEPCLRAIFSDIVLDEIAHLKFHWSFMRKEMSPCPHFARWLIYYFWSAVFLGISCVFVVDHREALRALGRTPRDFLHECFRQFRQDARPALLLE